MYLGTISVSLTSEVCVIAMLLMYVYRSAGSVIGTWSWTALSPGHGRPDTPPRSTVSATTMTPMDPGSQPARPVSPSKLYRKLRSKRSRSRSRSPHSRRRRGRSKTPPSAYVKVRRYVKIFMQILLEVGGIHKSFN